MTSTTPNTPANGGKILTDERIKELADQINWANVEWDYEAQLKFARAIEADLLAALAAPASVPQPAVQSIDTEEFRKLCDAYHCASQSALEDAYYAIVYHVDEEVSDLAHSWRLVVAQPAAQVAVSEDEQLALMVKVEDYMGAVDWAGTQIHAKCDAAEAAIFSKVNEIILCRAVPAPVSGMPDLALDVPNDALRTALAFMGFIDSDVQALAAKFALPVQTMAEILQHMNVLPALQAPDTPNPTGETK